MKYGAKRRIYTLTGLRPEIIAVAFAKCSRSPQPFDQIAQELDADKSRKFHEKWVVGYGHSSVAEHAVISLALENVSILATKVIEDNRLASYTEKSTRYQKFDKEHYYKPPKLIKSNLGKIYQKACDFYFDTYDFLVPKMYEFMYRKYPQGKDEEDKPYQSKIKNKVFDVCRYLLPTATQTNLGMTVNARELEYAICKFLSHPLEEIQHIGQEVKRAALKICPTLIKYADISRGLYESNHDLSKLTQKELQKEAPRQEESVVLIKYDKDAEERVIAALLYKFSTLSYLEIAKRVKKMSRKEKERVIDTAFKKMGQHDRPPRELEHTDYTFDILIDYGAFRDLQRHRICTQTNQYLTTDYKYSTPPEIIEAGFQKEYRQAMGRAEETFNKLRKRFPLASQYAIPLAFRKRILYTWNLRELYHVISLRTGKRGHPSYRKIVQEIYKKVKKVHPLLIKYVRVNLD